MSRIGIYSGTFDPIHEGHVLFAQVAVEQFGVDEVLIVPEVKPRHKDGVLDVDIRRAMVSLAILENKNIHLFDNDAEESHTVNGLLASVAKEYPDDEYFILLGEDVFRGMGEWGKRDDEDGSVELIKDSVGFIVGINGMSSLDELKEIQNNLGINVRYIEVPLAGISSSKIKEKLKKKSTPVGINDDVAEFIRKFGLYR